MILRKHHRILVFGATGRQGTFWTNEMIQYGANIVGAVNPRKAGTMHLGLPVYASATDISGEFDVALMFVPPFSVKEAVIDACSAGASLIVCLAEHIPSHDVMEMLAVARTSRTRIAGPNTAGLVTPGETFAGIMPAFNQRIFIPGPVGVISRSGSLGALACLNLTHHGLGQSAFFGIGGDPIIGTTMCEALQLFDNDDKTSAIVLCGEIGGTAEEEAAEYASTMNKPIVAFIAGRASPPGKKMGHAGAIVNHGQGSFESKHRHLKSANIALAQVPSEIPHLISSALPTSK